MNATTDKGEKNPTNGIFEAHMCDAIHHHYDIP